MTAAVPGFSTTPTDRTYRRDKDGKFSSGGRGAGASWSDAATGGDALDAAASGDLSPDAAAALGQYGRGHYYRDDKQVAIHQHVNSGLRNGRGDLGSMPARDRAVAAGLDAAMDQTGGISTDIIVHRSASAAHVFGADATDGDITGLSWRDHGFVSTSTTDRADDFRQYGGPSDRIAMRILVPTGTRGLSSPDLDSGSLDFDEVLLNRGLTFTVVADRGTFDGARQIDVQVS